MKIAGRKNDGAWMRGNKAIKRLDTGQKAALATKLQTLPGMPAAHAAVLDLQSESGVSTSNFPSTPTAWGTVLAEKGIPRQVYMGQLSYDIYEPYTYTDGDGDDVQGFRQKHGAVMRQFGIEVRQLIKEYIFGLRAVTDLANVRTRDEGNPSGIADATAGN